MLPRRLRPPGLRKGAAYMALSLTSTSGKPCRRSNKRCIHVFSCVYRICAALILACFFVLRLLSSPPLFSMSVYVSFESYRPNSSPQSRSHRCVNVDLQYVFCILLKNIVMMNISSSVTRTKQKARIYPPPWPAFSIVEIEIVSWY